MVPVIRITDATWERLKHWAVPLEDSPEDAVRKVLDAAEEHLKCNQPQLSKKESKNTEKLKTKISRLPKGLKTPNQTYRRPILEALYELGGSADAKDVLKVVEEKLKPRLNEFDLQKLPSSSELRWHKTANFVRLSLVKDGLLKDDSPRGIWELSDLGYQEIGKRRA
jgi:hypothetical protein